MNLQRITTVSLLALAATLASCKKEQPAPAADTAAATAPAAAPATGAQLTPAAGGKVIVVQAETDAQGNNKFTPNEIEAHQGDVLRFTLVQGVHNVHFLADSNPGKTGLPPASELLQLPGQTHDIAVSFDKGTYYFQCDPHAALGMKGHLKVD